jgi:3'-5' exonuclease
MSIIYLDVETIPAQRPDVVAWMAARALAKGESPEDSAKTYRASSLSPVLGELAVVSLAMDDGEPLTWARNMASPTGERDLIDVVASELRAIHDDCRVSRVVAHNAAFDRTVLRTRAMVHGIKLPYWAHALNLKPWDSPWWCTMEALRADFKGGVSLDAACVAFGVPMLKGDIDGSKVWDAICAGRIDEVAAYCADDVRRVRAVYQRIMGVTG